MNGYLMTATYATKTGRPSRRTLILDRPTSSEAIDEFIARLGREGCSKIDITSYGREKP